MVLDIFKDYGEFLLQQHEGSGQLASALAESVRVSVRRFAELLKALRHHAPDKHLAAIARNLRKPVIVFCSAADGVQQTS